MINRMTMLCAMLMTSVALTACEDEYENLFEVFSTDQLEPDSSIPISEFLPGEWDAICVVAPGDRPIQTIKTFLPRLNADWLADRRIQDYDFPDGLYKIILIASNSFRALISNQNVSAFKRNSCFDYKSATLHVGPQRKSFWTREPIMLDFDAQPVLR